MYDMNDEWDRYMTRYDGYSLATLDGFMEDGIATYDAATDTYTVKCDHYNHDPAGCSGTFTVGLTAEFAAG